MVWIGIYVLLVVVIFLQGFIFYQLRLQSKKVKELFNKIDYVPEVKSKSSLTMDFEEEIRRTTELQWLRIRNAIQKQSHDIHKKEMELAPKQFLYSQETLSTVFNDQQMDAILSFSNTYQQYLTRFWYTKNGNLKSVFTGSTNDPHSEVGQLVRSSHELCHLMDKWFLLFHQN
ncbi:hypothetical protein [Salipaludibacillus sp. CF4.18]|uniref:hypothetical protein n=1 Tax=Salipaludibacillus sp. CF4.18 TaxID=3373081 RepID=UPI003EE81C1A